MRLQESDQILLQLNKCHKKVILFLKFIEKPFCFNLLI